MALNISRVDPPSASSIVFSIILLCWAGSVHQTRGHAASSADIPVIRRGLAIGGCTRELESQVTRPSRRVSASRVCGTSRHRLPRVVADDDPVRARDNTDRALNDVKDAVTRIRSNCRKRHGAADSSAST